MNTNDADDIRPDSSQFDWTKAEIGRGARMPGVKTEIRIDGAVGYQLRLIASTLEAWPAIIATVEGGRSTRTLSLDWVLANGRSGSISAGPRLARWARYNNGEPHSYENRTTARA